MDLPARFPYRVLLFAALLLAAGTARAEWNTASSPGFTYCLAAANDCSNVPFCMANELVIGGSCERACSFSDFPCFSRCRSRADPGWFVLGEGSGFQGGGFNGDELPIFRALLLAGGQRLSDELFEIDVDFEQRNGIARAELALLRYAGDPAAFEDLRVDSVGQLVDLGLIEETDILFLEPIEADYVNQVYEVDVSGIPDEHLVLFTVGEGRWVPIPATDARGTLVVAGLLLAIGGWCLVRRRETRRD
jgi:hypothetical protein